MPLFEDKNTKVYSSKDYNFYFNKNNGLFMRWGASKNDNPQVSPIGPEIADIEISVNGCPNACPWCYKGNTNATPSNMTLETYAKILDAMPHINGTIVLTQVALGITGVQTNPAFVDILRYTRSLGVVPNFTLSGLDLTPELAKEIARYVGAVAVSAYPGSKDVCYQTVRTFLDLGVAQTNIHLMYHDGNEDFIYSVLNDVIHDHRLADINAVVLLGLKPRGRADAMQPMSQAKFDALVHYALEEGIPFGFDSCSAPRFLSWMARAALSLQDKTRYEAVCEPCESTLFSVYINQSGLAFPCSFCEHVDIYDGVNVLAAQDFLTDVWHSAQFEAFRSRILQNNRKCFVYPGVS